jgi:hypothetical protein
VTGRLDLERCGQRPVAGGGFGDVYEGTLVGGRKVAIKRARLHLQQGNDGCKVLKVGTFLNSNVLTLNVNGNKHAARELYAWSSLKHNNIVGLIGLAQFRGQIAMISPWMENGHLPDYISRNPDVDRIQLVSRSLKAATSIY